MVCVTPRCGTAALLSALPDDLHFRDSDSTIQIVAPKRDPRHLSLEPLCFGFPTGCGTLGIFITALARYPILDLLGTA
jgi:hypothetical protein